MRARATLPLVVGIALSLPAMSVGLVHDDLVHRVVLEGLVEDVIHYGELELYEFTPARDATARLIDVGAAPWWTDRELSLRFARPLSSALLWVDHALFGRAALPAHLHSIAWFAALIVAATLLFRRVLPAPAATIAACIYAAAGAHAMPTAWIAARHTPVSAALGVAAIVAHVAWRERGSRAGAILAPGLLALSLLASETWLGAVVYVVLYEAIVPRETWRRRALHAAPSLALGLVYVAWYVAAGYGARNSGVYISPTEDPGRFALAALVRIPAMMGELFGGLPIDAWSIADAVRPVLVVWGLFTAGAVALVLLGLRRALDADRSRRLVWLAASAIVGLVPTVGAVLGGRLLPLALLGSAALVATAMVEAWTAARARRGVRRVSLRAVVVALALVHFVVSPSARLWVPLLLRTAGDAEERIAREAELGRCAGRGDAFLVNGSDPSLSMYGLASLLLFAPERAPASYRVLSMAPHDHVVRRVDASVIEVETVGAPRRAHDFEQVYRSIDRPLPLGSELRAGPMTVRVLGVAPDGWTRARFDVGADLDRGAACLVVYRDGRLHAIDAPAIGDEEIIAHEPGPLGL